MGGNLPRLLWQEQAEITLSPPTSISRSASPLTPEQAVKLAVNDLQPSEQGYRLSHPRYSVDFSPQGLYFVPRHSALTWAWQLTYVGAAQAEQQAQDWQGPAQVEPHSEGEIVRYARGDLVEQYVLKKNTLEQQFILLRPLALDGADLVIAGLVDSTGAFEFTERGWKWSLGDNAVHLGKAFAYDAQGVEIPVNMQAEAGRTRILVDGQALATAVYPVTVDPEIGANDFRISDMGLNDTFCDVHNSGPAVAYNSTDNQYLVVWSGDNLSGAMGDNEFEIWGQRIDAATGDKLGEEFRISDMGPDGNANYNAIAPSVAYNSTGNQYLVVWQGDDNTPPLVADEYEIFGQRLDATGGGVGANDFRISDMGPDGDNSYDAESPAVVYNRTDQQYLVVWSGVETAYPGTEHEYEIYGQRLNATGDSVGANDFRISDMGPDGVLSYGAGEPAVAYNLEDNEYLVVWHGIDNTPPLVADEYEIFGQRLNAATGAEVGTNDYRLSDMGPNGNIDYGAFNPSVAYNSTNYEYLVVWYGDDNTAPLVNGEFEIFGQRLSATMGGLGTNDFRISDMGPNGDTSYSASYPSVVYNSTDNQYLVVWKGNDNTASLANNEYEIFGQRLSSTGGGLGTNDFRISDMGPDGDTSYKAEYPALAYGATNNEYLVVWRGDDDLPSRAAGESEMVSPEEPSEPETELSPLAPDVDNEYEVFGQRLSAETGAELGTNDFRISVMGPDMEHVFDAFEPAVAYNSTNNQYLVVWSGDTLPEADNAMEIYGQRLNADSGARVDNRIRISDMGLDGDNDYGAYTPSVAYNSTNNEYLVVWKGDDNTAPLVNNEFEIFGQRLNAATGAEIGTNDFRISDMGPDGEDTYEASYPSVVYNSTNNEYLVAWKGDDNTAPLVDNEFEIFGQRLNAATGAEVGTNDYRLSDMGPNGDASYNALFPSVAYNSMNNEYLVVWYGDDNTTPLVDDEFEIFGQRLSATMGGLGTNDFRISDMGPNGDVSYDAFYPSVVYNSTNNEYLVVWYGDDNTAPLVKDEFEIFGQRLSATMGGLGPNDFRISDMGSNGDTQFGAFYPSGVYDSTNNEFLVVWSGDDNTALLVENEYEIHGQRLSASGVSLGTNDFRISDMGPDGDIYYAADYPAGAWSSMENEYLVVWVGIDDIPPLVQMQFEIFGQRLAPDYGVFLPVVMRP
jgi:hypothetical protein